MTTNTVQWKIGGEAGFGIMTTGQIFARICSRAGLQVFAYPEYPSLIRGGHNTYQIAVHDQHATSQRKQVDLLVALNKETVELHADQLVDGSVVIYDPKDFKGETPTVEGKEVMMVPVEMSAIVKEHRTDRVARNTIAIGASFGLLEMPWEHVESVVRDWFSGKKPEFVETNITLAKAGYDAVEDHFANFPFRLEPIADAPEQMVVSGNAAIAMGAVAAGMKFYAAYPMTPSSDLLGYFAKKERDYKLVVKHTEDEIAAINMVIGAAYAGVRAMTATSGGGFALMGEALGMAGLAETPMVAMIGQRPGPSTGLPTWSSQADLRFVLHASQGEFPRIVLTPGDAEECFMLTHKAFNLAEQYQCPVLIVVDKYNQQSWMSAKPFDTSGLKIDRGALVSQEDLNAMNEAGEAYKRHLHTDTGISPRAIPGMEYGRHIASSYEHWEDGHTTEDEAETVKQNDKRFRKLEVFLENDAEGPTFYGPENADVTLVGWGSTKLPALEALALAEAEGISVNYLHFTYIDPLPKKEVEAAFEKVGKTIMVEANKLGQLEGWIREHTGITMDAHFRKYGGRPFYPTELLAQAKDILNA